MQRGEDPRSPKRGHTRVSKRQKKKPSIMESPHPRAHVWRWSLAVSVLLPPPRYSSRRKGRLELRLAHGKISRWPLSFSSREKQSRRPKEKVPSLGFVVVNEDKAGLGVGVGWCRSCLCLPKKGCVKSLKGTKKRLEALKVEEIFAD